jgi:hypothetical protein
MVGFDAVAIVGYSNARFLQREKINAEGREETRRERRIGRQDARVEILRSVRDAV